MKKYASTKGNGTMLFKTREEAMAHANKTEGTFEEYNAYAFDNPNSLNRFSSEETIRGENIIDAIEENFLRITKVIKLYGVSGYTLERAYIEHLGNNQAKLTVCGWPFSEALVGFSPDMLSGDTLEEVSLILSGVPEEEIPNGKYDFEVKGGGHTNDAQFSVQFANTLKAKKLTYAKLEEKMGIPERTAENWKAGKRIPPVWSQKLVLEKINTLD
jgi:hypothetical protein